MIAEGEGEVTPKDQSTGAGGSDYKRCAGVNGDLSVVTAGKAVVQKKE